VSVFLVTGGAGFIGSNLTETLLSQGEDVTVLDNFSTGRRENLADVDKWASKGGGRFSLIEGDIRDAETCDGAVAKADYVLHQAAIPSVVRSVEDPITTNAVNVGGTLNLLDAARRLGVDGFVIASSSSLYGDSEVLPKVETMPPNPISPYGLQKLTAESYCRLFHALYGVPTVALRYFNVFGPRQDPASEYAAVVPRFITAIKSGSRPTIYGDGEQTRDFTFIRNVVQANLLAARANGNAQGRAFNIACGDRISLNDLVGQIGGLLGVEVNPDYQDARPGDIKHSLAGIEAARKNLRYDPQVDLRGGLERTLGAY